MDLLNTTTDPDERTRLMGEAQRLISSDYVNGYLFQLAKLGVESVTDSNMLRLKE